MGFGLGYHEENDMLIRMRRRSYDVVVSRGNFVFHGDTNQRGFFGSSMRTVLLKAACSFANNYLRFIFKNGIKERNIIKIS